MGYLLIIAHEDLIFNQKSVKQPSINVK